MLIAGLLIGPIGSRRVASAQAPCSISAQFTALANDLGRSIFGECMEEARTLGADEMFSIRDRVTVTVPAGSITQQTTNGFFRWTERDGTASFLDSWGEHSLGPSGFLDVKWDQIAVPQVAESARPPAPPATTVRSPAVARPEPTRRPEPDPALVSRCIALADEFTALMGSYDGRIFDGILDECRRAAEVAGYRGINCYDAVWRPFVRNWGSVPFTTGAISAVNGEVSRCISGR
jgi:hypothetical protein